MLKVLSEYPEAKMTSEEQASSLGETFQELVKRLDDGISLSHTFPNFTLSGLELGPEYYYFVSSRKLCFYSSFFLGPWSFLRRSR